MEVHDKDGEKIKVGGYCSTGWDRPVPDLSEYDDSQFSNS